MTQANTNGRGATRKPSALKNFTFLALVMGIAALIPIQVSAQNAERVERCGTTAVMQRHLQQHPERKQAITDLDIFTRQFTVKKAQKSIASTEKRIIPVVVHVIHNNGHEYISMAQVQDAIRILNQDFNLQNPDTGIIHPDFRHIQGNTNFEFRLATIDPDGNCTSGVTYTKDANTASAGENVKRPTAWNTAKYYNIWVVRSIANDDNSGGTILGYAYYPGSWPNGDPSDGVLIIARAFGTIGSGNASWSSTLSHETGHYINLRHTFGNNNGPGPHANCYEDDGDQVDDTPPTTGQSSGCNLNQANCDGLRANVENFMDYSDCGRMFTIGQSLRMQAAIESNFSARDSLWTENNLRATGTFTTQGQVCPPRAVLYAPVTYSCSGTIPITFKGYIENSVTDTSLRFTWILPGATPDTVRQSVATVYYNTPGMFDVKLIVSNRFGSDTVYQPAYITADGGTAGITGAFQQSFENGSFPVIDPSSNYVNWTVSPDTSWILTPVAGWSGQGCVYTDPSRLTDGDYADILSPIVDISSLRDSTDMYLSYHLAYAKKNAANTDELSTWYTNNCGLTWTRILTRNNISQPRLATVINPVTDPVYIPVATDWRRDSIKLNIQGDVNHIRFRLRMKTGGGGGHHRHRSERARRG
ncbi:MAG: M43 family zinc metalloprotease, partial [Bacteroidota bacterium]